MKKFKKLLSVLLVATMIFTTFSMDISVSAENVTTETTATSDSPLEIEVTTNKSSYGLFDVADITVNITNTSDNTVENISAEAIFDDLAPVKKKASETYKEVECLQSGESFSFSYKATISKNKLNFFEKIALWFVRLFNGGFTANENNFDDGRDNISKIGVINFGRISANNEIKVWYELEALSYEDVIEMNKVDKSINDLMNSNDYKNLDSNKSKVYILMEKLSQLEKEGLIEKNSICYYEKSNQITFNYSNGVPSGILIDSVDNSTSNDNLFDVIGQTSSLNSKSVSVETVAKSINRLNGITMYGYDDSSSEDSYYDEWDNLIQEISDFGMTTSIYDKASVSDYKTAFIGYDYICIFEHGIYLEGYNTCSFIVAGENASEELDVKYGEDINENRIYKLLNNGVAKYYITPKFFSHYYSDNRLEDSFVFLLSCQSFGAYGEMNYGFAEAFYNDCGCDAIIGFHNSVFKIYGTVIFKDFTINMLCGNTAQKSLDICTERYGVLDINYLEQYLLNMQPIPEEYLEKYNRFLAEGNHAFPCLYDVNNQPGTISGTVKDKTTNNAISEVKVSSIFSGSGITSPITTTMTDENGDFSLSLPNGTYALIFTHDNYENYGWEVTVNNGDVTLSEPILLTPKSQSDTVEYNGHQYKLFDLSMSWEEAKAYCENLGGHLATITSQDEQAFIETLLNDATKNSYWLGAQKINNEWTWVTSEKWGYTNWALKQPDNNSISPNEDSLLMYNKDNPKAIGNTKGTWNDLYHDGTCGNEEFFGTDNIGFICEWGDTFVIENNKAYEYPSNQQYWIIFTEGFRQDRVEISTIDSTLSSNDLFIVWDTSLEISDSSKSGKCEQYYLDENDEWVYMREYSRLTDKATNIIASNLDVYDKNGNLILKKCSYSDVDWDKVNSYR